MRKILPLIFAPLLWLFSINQATAQTRGLGIVNARLIDSTIVAGDSIILKGTLFNFDSASAFDGNINFKLNLNNRDILYGEVEVIQDSMRYVIPGNTGTPFTVVIPVTLHEFEVGPNVIIIWPISNRPYIDSVTKIVNVIEPLSIMEEQSFVNNLQATIDEEGIRIANNAHPKFRFQQVRIFDVSGSLIFSSFNSNLKEINLNTNPNQVYFCEFIVDADKRKVLKLIRH